VNTKLDGIYGRSSLILWKVIGIDPQRLLRKSELESFFFKIIPTDFFQEDGGLLTMAHHRWLQKHGNTCPVTGEGLCQRLRAWNAISDVGMGQNSRPGGRQT
jgi:hypothetical protein